MSGSTGPPPGFSSDLPTSALLELADQTLIHHAGPFDDLIVERASGSVITDRDGNEYLDFTSGQLCATFGHNPPELREAIMASFSRAVHTSSLLLSEEVTLLAQRLV